MSIIKMRSTRAKPERHLDDTTPYGPVIAIAFTFVGKPSAPVYLVMVDDIELDYNGSRGFAVVAATVDSVFHLNRIDEQGVPWPLGLFTFKATKNNRITITGSMLKIFAGEVLQMIPPQNQDASLSDVSITVRAYRV